MRRHPLSLVCIAVLSSLSYASQVHAQNGFATWTGLSPAGDNWSDFANWANWHVPAFADHIRFGPAAPRTWAVVNEDFTIAQLNIFDDVLFRAPAYQIRGSGTLTILGVISNSSATPQAIYAPIKLGDDNGLTISGGGLTIHGRIDTNGKQLYALHRGNVRINGVISGSGYLRKNELGRLELTQSNTYTGDTIVEWAVLRLSGAGRLSDSSDLILSNREAIFEMDGVADAVRSLSGSGTVRLINDSTLVVGTNVGAPGSGSFSGPIQGAGGLIKRGTGTLNLSGINTYSGSTLIDGGTLNVTRAAVSPDSFVIVNSGLYTMTSAAGVYSPEGIEVRGLGTARLAAGADKLLRTRHVSVTGAGTLDLTDNELLLDDGNLQAIAAMVVTARNGGGSGRWTGPGITSSAAADNPLTTLAIGLAGNDVIVKHTYNGDANLDGLVNADDYFRIDQGFLAQPSDPLFSQGDFNYDGRINADDYFLIDQAFLGQGAALASSLGLLATAAVPEPGVAVAALSGVCSLLRRRRK